jgi:hypothetical protein
MLGRGAATKSELAVRRGERCVKRVEQLVGFASDVDIDVLGGASCGPHATLNRYAALEQEARARMGGRCALQRIEQRHDRYPSPHAIGGYTVVAAVTADELLEVTFDGAPVATRDSPCADGRVAKLRRPSAGQNAEALTVIDGLTDQGRSQPVGMGAQDHPHGGDDRDALYAVISSWRNDVQLGRLALRTMRARGP